MINWRSRMLASRPGAGMAVCRQRQRGVAMLAMLTLLTLWGMYLFLGQLSTFQVKMGRTQSALAAMAEARDALIGDAISRSPVSDAGYLRLPDLGADLDPGVGWVPAEGGPSPSFLGNQKDLSVIGKFPWKTKTGQLASPPLRDAQQECLWYVVSGRFKIVPKTDAMNWDTAGQIDIIDSNGNLIATNLAALLVAPGQALDGQNRDLTDPIYTECGGNYDARNYLDSFNATESTSAQVNYFAGSTNHRLAPNTNNKRFVIADSDHYNDLFLYITVDDIFKPLIRRNDFSDAIGRLLDDPAFQNHLRSIDVTGSKGTDKLSCSSFAPDDDFCNSWKEMLFLAQLSPSSQITINGLPSSQICSRVLIFGGRKTVGQIRNTATEKADKNNYLEGNNLTSFNVPNASSTSFSGSTGNFNAASPSTDLVRCLP